MPLPPDTTIIGIDPGTQILGFGVLAVRGGRPAFVDMGVVEVRTEKNPYAKLRKIFDEVGLLCDRYRPSAMALESPFLGKNAQVVLKLGRAQGAAILSAESRGIAVYEYAPRKAKVAITGNGAASKEQVRNMIGKLLEIEIEERFLDATDALAIALCHYYGECSPISGLKDSGSWERFLREHPDRIK